LTKRMAEDLSEYFTEIGVRCRYLHSEVETLDRIKFFVTSPRRIRRFDRNQSIARRTGLARSVVGGNLDADKEGYLRSATSLIQTMGRCARHISGRAILYADTRTGSMNQAISETNRRREKQLAYNQENNITPESIVKSVDMELARIVEADYVTIPIDEAALDTATAQRQERTATRRIVKAARRTNATNEAEQPSRTSIFVRPHAFVLRSCLTIRRVAVRS